MERERQMLVFNHAIRFADGRYYTGRAGDGMYGERHEAFTYTEAGAHAKIERMRWRSAIVERVN